MYAAEKVIYRNFSPETFKNSAILQTFASLPEKKFHESGTRHGIFWGVIFWPRVCLGSSLQTPPPGPLGLHPILPKSFVYYYFWRGEGKPRELKKHKLNKIKGKCQKKDFILS